MSSRGVNGRVPYPYRPSGDRRSTRGFTDSVEEYVEGIFRLQAEIDMVTTGSVATYMGVSAGSATTMVKRLADMGLAHHEPYQGLRLTLSGERLAKRLVRAHRVLEAFLVQTLDLSWEDVHEPACKLAHYVADDLVERIESRIGGPLTCPHGNPVDPDRRDGSFRLGEAVSGVALRVVRVTDERAEYLQRLESLGLSLGTEVEIESESYIDGSMNLAVGDRRMNVAGDVTRHVWVVAAGD